MSERYMDFHLYVGPDGHIRTHSEPGGDQTTMICLDELSDIERVLELIEQNRTDDELLKIFGATLYRLIFPTVIGTHLNQTEAVANYQQHKLRIRLSIEPDNLACLPWEFLYREGRGYFLATNPSTVLSRYLNLDLPLGRVRGQPGPLHLLIIIANPSDQEPLDSLEWEKTICKALALPINEQKIRIKTVQPATFENIRDALLAQNPDIIQFVGHGLYKDGKGALALVNDDNKTWMVDDEGFAEIFQGHDDRLGLVSLMACESAKSDSHQSFLGIAPQIVRRGVPAVVAMQYSVLASTAEIFLENFYASVAARKPVDWAVQQGRKAIAVKMTKYNREFATPVLYMRAKDGEIF